VRHVDGVEGVLIQVTRDENVPPAGEHEPIGDVLKNRVDIEVLVEPTQDGENLSREKSPASSYMRDGCTACVSP